MFLAFVVLCFNEPPNFIMCVCDMCVFCVVVLSFVYDFLKFRKFITLQYVLVFSEGVLKI